MATPEQIQAAIQRKRIQAAIDRKKVSRETIENPEPELTAMEREAIMRGPFESAAIGMGRGLKNISDALRLTESDDFEKEAMAVINKESPLAIGGGEVVGEALPFLPAGIGAGAIKSAVPRIAASTAVGAVEGGLAMRGRGKPLDEQLAGAGIGGAITGTAEALYPVISRIGGALFRKVTGKTPTSSVIDSTGNPTPEFQVVLDQSGTTMDDLAEAAQTLTKGGDPAQVERKAFIESQGLKPTKAQVTRDATDFQAQQEAAKTSGKVRAALEGQEALIVNKFDSAIAGTGGEALTTGSPVIDQVINKTTTLDNKISDLYSAARKSAKESGQEVRLVKLKNLLGQSKSDDSLTGGVVSSVIGDLESKGIIKDGSLKSISIDDAEKIRIRLNQLSQSTNDFGRMKIREFKDALDEDVLGQSGGDLFSSARAAKRDYERDLSRAKVSKFDKNRKSLVRDMLENKIDPDDFANRAVFSKSYRADDLNSLRRYMLSGTKEQRQAGLKAWQDLRAETLEIIRDKAFSGPKDAAGNRALSAAGLKRALNQIGKARLNILFKGKEQKFLKDIQKLAELREPVRGTALGKGPSAQLVSTIVNMINSVPLLGAMIDGVKIARSGGLVLNATPRVAKGELSPIRRDIATGLIMGAVPASAAAVNKKDTTNQNQKVK